MTLISVPPAVHHRGGLPAAQASHKDEGRMPSLQQGAQGQGALGPKGTGVPAAVSTAPMQVLAFAVLPPLAPPSKQGGGGGKERPFAGARVCGARRRLARANRAGRVCVYDKHLAIQERASHLKSPARPAARPVLGLKGGEGGGVVCGGKQRGQVANCGGSVVNLFF